MNIYFWMDFERIGLGKEIKQNEEIYETFYIQSECTIFARHLFNDCITIFTLCNIVIQ